MGNWEINFYTTNSGRAPVIDYIKEQEIKRRVAIYNAIELIEEFGIGKSHLVARKIKGKLYQGLYEWKIYSSRIIYFLPTGKTCVLVHAFTKQKNKTPQFELDTARKRMKDYLRWLK